MTQAELAAYVQSQLLEAGITVVLSGGAAVSIYTLNRYVSRDIDLVNVYSVGRKNIRTVMHGMGFREKNRYYAHPDSRHVVEFPPGPLAIGDEPIKGISRIPYSTGTLRVISSTDCVKDRLAGYYFWGDQQSLVQAVMVARASRVNMAEIRRWSRGAGMEENHQIFLRKLASGGKRR
jgi:hypothetical protein